MIWSRREPTQAPLSPPWLRRYDREVISFYRTLLPTAVARGVFVKDNGVSSWIAANYPTKRFHFRLQRRIQSPQDWTELTLLAIGLSGITNVQGAMVMQAVTASAAQGHYSLEITPRGFAFVDHVGDFRTVMMAEGRF